MKILIVDDNKDNLDLLEILLKSDRFDVLSSSNGKEALEKLKTVKVDLIISDILMPVMDGFRLCQECKKDDKLKKIPFVFYSATYIDKKDEEFALSLGAQKFIRKPKEPDEFLKIIKDVLEDVKMNKLKSGKLAVRAEKDVFKLYNERLIFKLEKKMLDLEEEVTHRKLTERELNRISRALRVISKTNKVIIKSVDEPGLLKKVCGIIVREGKYRLAWIGYTKQGTDKSVLPVSQSGFEKGYLDKLNITWADTKKGRGPTGTAIRTSKVVIAKNIQTDPDFEPWRSEAVKRGYGSSIALPLIMEGKVFGALNIYAVEPNAFDKREVELLKELAGDLSFGINSLRAKLKRKIAEETLQESEQKYRRFFEEDLTGDFISTPEGKILFCNPAFVDILGFGSIDEALNASVYSLYFDAKKRKKFLQLLIENKMLKQYEQELIRKDGKKITVMENVIGIFDGKGKLNQIKGYLFDITKRKKAEIEVLNSREQLRNLSSHLQTIREEERGSISREIHDELGQFLTALKIDAIWLDKHFHESKDKSSKKIKGMIELVNDTIRSIQKIAAELRPGILDELGLSSAILWYANEYKERTGIKCKVDINPEKIKLDEKLSIAVYRIFQESLTNVMRHAKATKVNVCLELIKNNLSLVVKDNGVGIDEEKLKDPKSLGITGMQERVYPWGGTVKISGVKEKGTTVHVNVKC